MAKPSKIDEQVLLELVTKGLSQKEMANYFGVRQSSVRSKLQTCAKRDARYAEAFCRKTNISTNTNAPLSDRLDNYALRMFSDAASVLNKLNSIPIPDDIPSLTQRTDLQLKGLQLLEKVQKHLMPKDNTQPKSIGVNSISVYLSQSDKNNSEPELIEAEDVTS